MRRQVLAWRWLLAWKRAWALRRLLSLAGVAGRAGSTTFLSFSKPISKTSLFYQKGNITGLRISGRSGCELVRRSDCPLHPLDGRREAPDRKRMTIRSPDGAGAERPRHRRGKSPRRTHPQKSVCIGIISVASASPRSTSPNCCVALFDEHFR